MAAIGRQFGKWLGHGEFFTSHHPDLPVLEVQNNEVVTEKIGPSFSLIRHGQNTLLRKEM